MHHATRRLVSRIVCALALWCVTAAPAAAEPVYCWDLQNLEQLIASGEDGCVWGRVGRHFFDFAYTVETSGGATEISAGDIAVEFGAGRSLHLLQFAGNWSVEPGQTLEGTISYSFGDMRLTHAELAACCAATVEAILCAGDTFPCDEGAAFDLGLFLRVPLHGTSAGSVQTFFSLEGPPSGTLEIISHTFLVPEPGVVALLACGAVLYATRIRRRASAQAVSDDSPAVRQVSRLA